MIKLYNRLNAIYYAKLWAYKRNPQYFNFDTLGGDCTNFVSQCIFAGCNVMNYTPTFGWYYRSISDRSPSWTGVNYLYNFLISNTTIGPFGEKILQSELMLGDIVQFGNSSTFYHSAIVVSLKNGIYLASHSLDSYMREIKTYSFEKIRYIHISGIRISTTM